MTIRPSWFLVLAIALVLRAAPADASSHSWRFNEFYSSPHLGVQLMTADSRDSL